MNEEHLVQILASTYSPVDAQRLQAEEFLQQNALVAGFHQSLLQLAVKDGIDPTVRQVAAISFKNGAKRYWETHEDRPGIPEQEKAAIKENLVECLVRSSHQVQVQMQEMVKVVIYADWPEKWPSFVGTVQQNLRSGDLQRVYGGLLCLRVLARKYEFKDQEQREPFLNVINGFLPGLLDILKLLLGNGLASPDLALLVKQILKIFWSTAYFNMPVAAAEPTFFQNWMEALHLLLTSSPPADGLPSDPEELEKSQWWKMKKWTLHNTLRLFQRYSDPAILPSDSTDHTFAANYASSCLVPFLKSHLDLLLSYSQGQFLSNRCINLLMQYLTHAVQFSRTYQVVQDRVPALVTDVCLPLLAFNDEDQELWLHDPQEYIRKGNDLVEEFQGTRPGAMNLLQEIVKPKKRANELAFVMSLLSDIMEQHHAAAGTPAGVPVALARRMDGAMFAVGTLSQTLQKKKKYRPRLEPMLIKHVLPLFDSPYGFLRAKAHWVAGTYAEIPFTGGHSQGGTFFTCFQKVIMGLQDRDMPVKVDAMLALRYFFDAAEDLGPITPIMPQLLDAFFQLMQNVDQEDMVFTLDTLVERFGDDIQPFAVQMAKNLLLAFNRCVDGQAGGDDDDVGAVAAYGCLRALNTLCEAVHGRKELVAQLEDEMFPLLKNYISSDGQDVLEELLDLVTFFTYFRDEPSKQMWSLWPQMHQVFMEWGIDYFEHFLLPFDNFITKGTDHFITCQSPNYLQSVFLMCQFALEGDFTDKQVESAPMLMGVVLQACRGRVDSCVAPFMELSLKRLPRTESNKVRDLLVEVVANALYYNAALALAELEARGMLAGLLQSWFIMIFALKPGSDTPQHFRSTADKKVCILGLASVLALPEDKLPEVVRSGTSSLVSGLLELCKRLKEQLDRHAAQQLEEEEEEEEEEDDDDDEAEKGLELNAEEEEELLSRVRKSVQAQQRALEVRAAAAAGAGYATERWSVGTEMCVQSFLTQQDEEEDDEELETVLDEVDAFACVADVFQLMPQVCPSRPQQLQSSLQPQQWAELQALVQFGVQRKAEQQQ